MQQEPRRQDGSTPRSAEPWRLQSVLEPVGRKQALRSPNW